jgi:hypothetical protein
MNIGRLPKQISCYHLRGHRSVSSPMKRWEENIDYNRPPILILNRKKKIPKQVNNDRTIINDELGSIWDEMEVTCFKMLLQPNGTDENHK